MAAKQLHANQRAAVVDVDAYFRGTRTGVALSDGTLYHYPSQRTVILYGGTGCGKTMIAIHSAIRLNEKRVLVIVPPCGGVVFDQWVEECEEAGRGAQCCLYHGPTRTAELAAWRWKCDAVGATGVHFVITSIATLHSDAIQLLRARFPERSVPTFAKGVAESKRKKYSDAETRSAFASAAAALGKFDLMILDEFQEFRNGSPPSDEKRAIDPTKSYYVMLDAVASRSTPLVLGLSATPVVNSSGELYSFLRLGHKSDSVHDAAAKMALLERTRQNADPSVKRLFKDESRRIRSHMIVPVVAPVVPPTTHCDVVHTYTVDEGSVLSKTYGDLHSTTVKFLSALIAFLEQPENPVRRTNKDTWKNRFLSSLTHSKRATIAPLCFSRTRERALNAFEDPQRNSFGDIVMTTNELGKTVPLGRQLPFDVAAAHAAVPLDSISKFKVLIADLATLTDRRSMILCEFSDPIELLVLYMRDAFPARAIFKFHGSVGGRDKQLAAFKSGPPDGILVATRSSCGMAINVENTTLVNDCREAVVQYQLDLPMAQSMQNQAEGRIKRPIAQGYPNDPDRVRQWIVKKVKADFDGKNTLEDWLEKVMVLKNARCADMLNANDEERADGRDTSIDTNDGLDGPLKKLVEVLSVYATAPSRKRSRVAGAHYSVI